MYLYLRYISKVTSQALVHVLGNRTIVIPESVLYIVCIYWFCQQIQRANLHMIESSVDLTLQFRRRGTSPPSEWSLGATVAKTSCVTWIGDAWISICQESKLRYFNNNQMWTRHQKQHIFLLSTEEENVADFESCRGHVPGVRSLSLPPFFS